MEFKKIAHPCPDEDDARRLSATYEFYYQPLLMFAFLVCSWWTSNTGVLAMGDWISGASDQTRQLALLVTACASGAHYALWFYAMRLIPRYATFRARGIGLAVVAMLLVLLGLSSTLTSWIGLSQDSARGLELRDQAHVYADKVDLLAPRAAAMEDALFVIAPEARAACARYEQELNTGAISGARGKGIVTGHLLRLCSAKTEIVHALEETIADNKRRMSELSALSARMDQVIYDKTKSIGERELEVLALARRMDAIFRELENSDRTKGLRAASASMAGSVAKLENATGALGQAQAQAIDAIIAEERASGDAISAFLAEIDALPLPVAERAEISIALILVLKYGPLHLTQLAMRP